ncbi:hypothetical protein SMICM304S_04364 [Streptomyces microflavus]
MATPSAGQAGASSACRRSAGDGRLRQEADDQPGDGDAELGAREHEGEPLQDGHRAGGPPVTGGGLAGERQRSADT